MSDNGDGKPEEGDQKTLRKTADFSTLNPLKGLSHSCNFQLKN